MRSKSRELFVATLIESYDIICLTETWLTDSFLSTELFNSNYKVIRQDREDDRSRGGGVLIAYSTKHSVLGQSSQYSSLFVDCLCVPIVIYSQKFILCVVYISPRSNVKDYLYFYDFLYSVTDTLDPQFKVIINGDFNMPHISSGQECKCQICQNFVNFCKALNIKQYNFIVNSNNRLLDLIVTECYVNVARVDIPLVTEDSHHPALLISFNIKNDKHSFLKYSPVLCYDYSQANFDHLYQKLKDCDFSNVTSEADINIAVQKFYTHVNSVMDMCIPKKLKKFNPKYPVYFSLKIIKLIQTKNKLYKKIKRCYGKNTDSKKCVLKQMQLEIKKLIRIAYQNYATLCEFKVHSQPKHIWKLSNEKLKPKNILPAVMTYKGCKFTSPADIAAQFARHFQSVYVTQALKDSPTCLPNAFTTHLIDPITEIEVQSSISSIKSPQSCGPDNIPGFIIKGCSYTLVPVLTTLFNKSVQLSIFPDVWKSSKVIPTFKKGDPDNIENYRAISIMNSISKVFEIVLNNRLNIYIKNKITPHQHGFVRAKSTVTNVASFTHFTCQALDSKLQVETVDFDFERAFDQVDHSILISKLSSQFDIPDVLILILKSYLHQRSQYVFFNGTASDSFLVQSGVPQGSILGPVLFTLFINDIVNCIKFSNILLYADDLKLFNIIRDSDDCSEIQSDIENIVN